MNETKPGFTREESLWLDGALAPDEARRVEERVASDPALAARVAAWREAMAMWRDDAARTGAVDGDRLTREVLARAPEARRVALAEARGLRRYAAAAVVLTGVGVAGSLWTESRLSATRPSTVASLEDAAVRLEADLEFRDRVLESLDAGAPGKEGG